MGKYLRVYIGLIAFVSFFSSIQPAQALTDRHFTLVPNVEYHERTLDRGVKLRALVFDPKNVRFGVEGKGGANVCTALFSAGEINTMSSDPSFIAAINAQFFRSGQGGDNSVIGDYIGNVVHYGKNWPSQQQNSPSVATEESGVIIQGTGVGLNESMVRQNTMFINGIFKINRSGNLAEISDANIDRAFSSAYSGGDARNPISRTFLGVDTSEDEDTGIDDNKIILMTGGSGSSRGNGVTPKEGVDFLKFLGATDAYILDSGGSTLMKINPRFANSNPDPATNAPNDGRGLADLLVIRTGSRQTQAEVANLPVKQCRTDQPQPAAPAQPVAPAQQNPAPAQPAAVVNQAPVTQNVQQVVPTQAVPLEVPIGDTNLISGAQNYILTYTKILFTYMAGLAGILALLMLIMSGFQIMIGGTEQIGKAKERIAGSLAGLVLLTCGGFVLYLINPCFYNFSNSSACTPRGPASTAVVVSNPEPANLGTGNGPATNEQPTNVTPGQPHNPRTPEQYAREKLPEAVRRWAQYSNDFTRARDVMFPGAAPEAFVGFASNGGITELTPGGTFQAMGMFGVETNAGGDAPVAGGRDRWFPLSTDPQVIQVLNRPATTEPNAWKTQVADQIAVGYAGIREHGNQVMNNRNFPASIRTTNKGSSWFVALAFMGWSAGDGTAVRIVSPFADRLASVPDNEKWGRFLQLMVEAGVNGTVRPALNTSGRFDSHSANDSPVGRYDTHDNPFYSVVRTMQKLEAGKALAQAHGGDVNFFSYPAGVNVADIHQKMFNLGYYGVVNR